MTEILNHLISQLNSSVFTLLGILFASFWGVYMVSKMIERFRHHESRLDRFDGLNERTIKIEKTLELVYLQTQRVPVALAHSPIALTPVGVEIATAINAPVLFSRYEDRLKKSVEEKAPSTAYDIQMEAMRITRESSVSPLQAS